MTRRYTVPATGTTRQSPPEKPYLWRGKPGLADLNARIRSERPDPGADSARGSFFSWPMPLPGPVHPPGNWTPKEAPGIDQEARCA